MFHIHLIKRKKNVSIFLFFLVQTVHEFCKKPWGLCTPCTLSKLFMPRTLRGKPVPVSSQTFMAETKSILLLGKCIQKALGEGKLAFQSSIALQACSAY